MCQYAICMLANVTAKGSFHEEPKYRVSQSSSVHVFTSSSSLNITLWDLLNDHDGKVFHGVPTFVEVLSHWFLCLLVFDVISVAVEANVQGILC